MTWKDQRQDMIAKILAEAEKIKSKGVRVDPRFWKLDSSKLKKEGAVTAVIRFLPAKGSDPWVRYLAHNVQVEGAIPGQKGNAFYGENCPETIGKPCPVCEYAKSHPGFNSANSWKYVSNIYVVSDPSYEENNGKVFLYQFGKQIMDMVMGAMSPNNEGILDPDDHKPVIIPHDFLEGANFQITLSKGSSGRPDYSTSSFLSKKPLSKKEEILDEIYEQTHNLNEFLSESNFKEYDVLSKRWENFLVKYFSLVEDSDTEVEQVRVIKPTVKKSTVKMVPQEVDEIEDDDEDEDEVVVMPKKSAPSKPASKPVVKAKKPPVEDDDEDTVDSIEHIKREMARMMGNDIDD